MSYLARLSIWGNNSDRTWESLCRGGVRAEPAFYHRDAQASGPAERGVFAGPFQQEEAALLRQANPSASLASWAIRFAAGLDGVLTVLCGMSAPAQLEDNTDYMKQFQPLTPEEVRLLEQVAGIIHAKAEIACTNCRYCTTECPKQIAIPDYFGLYNNMKRLKNAG